MLTLAIVACGPQLEVALAGPDIRGCSVVRLAGSSRRSSLVMAAVDLLFEDAGCQRSELGAVLVSRGPGSFTGIRSGLATASGLAAATGAACRAHDSLLCQAARVPGDSRIWAAQPGRRGEVYAAPFVTSDLDPPRADGEIQIVAVAEAEQLGPWVAPEALDLGSGVRAHAVRTAAEALIAMDSHGLPGQPFEPLYVEGPPIRRKDAVDGG